MNMNMSSDCSKNVYIDNSIKTSIYVPKNMSSDVRINIPKDNITYENIKQESLLVKLLKKLNIL